MLPSFRIRNLILPRNDRERLLPSHVGAHDVIVSLTGREYNENSTAFPESRLKYVDEEDGETVTIGTADELEQRLNEPVPAAVRYRVLDKDGKPYVVVLPPHFEPETFYDLHVFEIDRRGESVRIWEDITHRRMRETYDQSSPYYILKHPSFQPPSFMEASGQAEPAGSDNDDMSVQVGSDIDDESEHEMQYPDCQEYPYCQKDQHKFRFWASNPPTFSLEIVNSPAVAHAYENSSGPEGPISLGNLTSEGKRQAMHAGMNLRTRVDYPSRRVQFADSTKSATADHNRWASYGSAEAFTGPQVAELSKPDVLNIGESKESGKPLPGLLNPEVPKLYSSIDEAEKRFEPIGPLFGSYMTELGKLSSEARNGPAENVPRIAKTPMGTGAASSGLPATNDRMNPEFPPEIGQSSLLKSTYVDLYHQYVETAAKHARAIVDIALDEARAKSTRYQFNRSVSSFVQGFDAVLQDFSNASRALLLTALKPVPVASHGSVPTSQSVPQAVKSAPVGPDGSVTNPIRSEKKPATVTFTDPAVQEPANKTAFGTRDPAVLHKPLPSPWWRESTNNHESRQPRLSVRHSFEAFKTSSDSRDGPNRTIPRLQQSKSTSELRDHISFKADRVGLSTLFSERQDKAHEEPSYSETDSDYSFGDSDDDVSYNSSLTRGQILPPIRSTPIPLPTQKGVIPCILNSPCSQSSRAQFPPSVPKRSYIPPHLAKLAPFVPTHIETAPSGSESESDEPLHHDPTTVGAVSTCVDQLKDLGFGKAEDGGVGRLIVYAQAANGDLPDAIDMIDEEKKVYEARRSN